jgi:hypothetical protein
MQRILITTCLSLLVLMSSTGAHAERKYGMGGCGVGAMILGPKGGKFKQILAAYTNGSFSQTSAISSGSSGCEPDEKSAQIMKQEHFFAMNLGSLSKEMAQGEGQSLAALSETFGCNAAIQPVINNTLKDNYEDVFAAPGAMAALDATRESLAENPDIAANCQYLAL